MTGVVSAYDFGDCYPQGQSIDTFQGDCVEDGYGVTVTFDTVYDSSVSQNQVYVLFKLPVNADFVIHRCQNPINGNARTCGFLSSPKVTCASDYCSQNQFAKSCTAATSYYGLTAASTALFYYSAATPTLCGSSTNCCTGLASFC